MAESGLGGGMRSRRVLVVVAGSVVGLVVVIALASLVEHTAYAGHVLPGVHLVGTTVSGEKDTVVRDEITKLAAQLEREPIRAHAGAHRFTVDPSTIAYSVDVDATMRKLRAAGRDSNPLAAVTDTVLRRFRSDNVRLVVHYDRSRFEGLLDGWQTVLDTGLVEGNLKIVGTQVVEVTPHAGMGLQRDSAARLLAAALASVQRADLQLPTGVVQPEVGTAAVTAAAAQARRLLASNRTVSAGGVQVTLTGAHLAPALGTAPNDHRLDLTLNPAKLLAALGPAFAYISRPPVDATFAITPANSVRVVPSRDGHMIDTAALSSGILSGEPAAQVSFIGAHPKHDTAWATALGIMSQVSSFTTYFPPGQPRVHNIDLAADVLNNTVVEPGATFSLNGKLGERTPEKGYVKAPILVEDGFGEDFGGGISQLTTTLYNAVFFGGYVDVEHSPHAFYISRYPMGREATIVWPTVDLKFRNDTQHGVLIRTSYSATSITVTFYGNTDGRTVREENRKILQVTPVTDNLLTCPVSNPADQDPNGVCAQLGPGERSAVQSGETGYDVEFDRVIDQPGRPERRYHYEVHYPMLPNRILIGAGPPPSTTTTVAGNSSTTSPANQSPPTTGGRSVGTGTHP